MKRALQKIGKVSARFLSGRKLAPGKSYTDPSFLAQPQFPGAVSWRPSLKMTDSRLEIRNKSVTFSRVRPGETLLGNGAAPRPGEMKSGEERDSAP